MILVVKFGLVKKYKELGLIKFFVILFINVLFNTFIFLEVIKILVFLGKEVF